MIIKLTWHGVLKIGTKISAIPKYSDLKVEKDSASKLKTVEQVEQEVQTNETVTELHDETIDNNSKKYEHDQSLRLDKLRDFQIEIMSKKHKIELKAMADKNALLSKNLSLLEGNLQVCKKALEVEKMFRVFGRINQFFTFIYVYTMHARKVQDPG